MEAIQQLQVKQAPPAKKPSAPAEKTGQSKQSSFMQMLKKLQQGDTGAEKTTEQYNEELEMLKQLDAQLNGEASISGMQMMAEMMAGTQTEVTDISLMVSQITDAAMQKAGLPTSADVTAMEGLFGSEGSAMQQPMWQDMTMPQTADAAQQGLTPEQMQLLLEQQQLITSQQQASIGQEQAAVIAPQQDLFAPQDMPAQAAAQSVQPTTILPQTKKEVQTPVTSVQHSTVEQPQDELAQSMKFQQAVTEAQKLLKANAASAENTGADGKQQKTTGDETDIDALQERLNSGKMAHGAAALNVPVTVSEARVETVAKLPDAEEILAQVKTGITEGVASGKSEFVIKLKPDGLGEITVRLAEVGSRMSLSISASSAHTQRLLSGEIAGLREAMRPLGVEVEAVVSQEAGHFNAQQQSQFGAGQFGASDFGANARQQGRQLSQGGYYNTPENDAAQAQERVYTAVRQGLDTYI